MVIQIVIVITSSVDQTLPTDTLSNVTTDTVVASNDVNDASDNDANVEILERKHDDIIMIHDTSIMNAAKT